MNWLQLYRHHVIISNSIHTSHHLVIADTFKRVSNFKRALLWKLIRHGRCFVSTEINVKKVLL